MFPKLKELYARMPAGATAKWYYGKGGVDPSKSVNNKQNFGLDQPDPEDVNLSLKLPVKPIREEETQALLHLTQDYPKSINLPFSQKVVKFKGPGKELTKTMSPEEWETALLQSPEVENQITETSGLQWNLNLADKSGVYQTSKPRPQPNQEYLLPDQEEPQELEKKAQQKLAQTDRNLEFEVFSFAPEGPNQGFYAIDANTTNSTVRKVGPDYGTDDELLNMLGEPDKDYGIRGPIPTKMRINFNNPIMRGTHRTFDK